MVTKSKQRMASENGRWKGWKSSDFRRRITNAVKWEIVHHKDENKANNTKSNLIKIKPKDWMSATGVHNKLHPEKCVKWWKARAKQLKK